jgi:hypothetical protein
MSLSFSEEFFTGTESYPERTDRPTNVLQAIESLDDETKRQIAVHVLGVDLAWADLEIKTETFKHRVLDVVRLTNSCDDATTPVTVNIDEKRNFEVTFFDEVPLHPGDEVQWYDPDGGLASRILKIKTITLKQQCFTIEETDGSVVEGYLSELQW